MKNLAYTALKSNSDPYLSKSASYLLGTSVVMTRAIHVFFYNLRRLLNCLTVANLSILQIFLIVSPLKDDRGRIALRCDRRRTIVLAPISRDRNSRKHY